MDPKSARVKYPQKILKLKFEICVIVSRRRELTLTDLVLNLPHVAWTVLNVRGEYFLSALSSRIVMEILQPEGST
jgi:hypothetical protein